MLPHPNHPPTLENLHLYSEDNNHIEHAAETEQMGELGSGVGCACCKYLSVASVW